MAAMGTSPSPSPSPTLPPLPPPTTSADDDEEDPLDSFMRSLAHPPPVSHSSLSKPSPFDDDADDDDADDDDDDVDALLDSRDDDDDGDRGGEDDDGGGDSSPSSPDRDASTAAPRKQRIAELAPLDHSAIVYPPIVRPPYTPHPSLLPPMSPEFQSRIAALDVTSSPPSLTPPCPDLSLLPLPSALISSLSSSLSPHLTPIQSLSIPLALLHHNLIAQATTGSGKTLAYLLPLLLHCSHQPPSPSAPSHPTPSPLHPFPTGPTALILLPTRELASQVFTEARRLTRAWGTTRKWRVVALLGGSNRHEQVRAMGKGGGVVDVVVATPGRLLEGVEQGWCGMGRVSMVVLDEADRLMSMGFDRQVRSVVGQVRPDRQALLFSATMPERVVRLCRDVVGEAAVRVTAGVRGVVSEGVRQEVVVVKDDAAKLAWLISHLPQLPPPVLLFTSTQASCTSLHQQLTRLLPHLPSLPLHGSMHQPARVEAVRRLKGGGVRVVVATDVAARGLDVKGLGAVVVWEVGRDKDSHIHRVGRVGRAGREGRAVTLLTEDSGFKGGGIVADTMREAGEEVPVQLRWLPVVGTDRGGSDRRRGKRGEGGAGRGGRAGVTSAGRECGGLLGAVPPPPSLAASSAASAQPELVSAAAIAAAAAAAAAAVAAAARTNAATPAVPSMAVPASPLPTSPPTTASSSTAAHEQLMASAVLPARKSRWDR